MMLFRTTDIIGDFLKCVDILNYLPRVRVRVRGWMAVVAIQITLLSCSILGKKPANKGGRPKKTIRNCTAI